MHELAVTKSIYAIVKQYASGNDVQKVLAVNLEIGALSDLQNVWIQRYFDFLSKGSVADGAKLHVKKVPAIFKCNQCLEQFEIRSLLKEELACRTCRSKNVSLVSGKEYTIKSMNAI